MLCVDAARTGVELGGGRRNAAVKRGQSTSGDDSLTPPEPCGLGFLSCTMGTTPRSVPSCVCCSVAQNNLPSWKNVSCDTGNDGRDVTRLHWENAGRTNFSLPGQASVSWVPELPFQPDTSESPGRSATW